MREQPSNYSTYTCVFPENRLAVVQVQGAPSEAEARAFVQSVWYPHPYEVRGGNLTNGYVPNGYGTPFTLRIPPKALSVSQKLPISGDFPADDTYGYDVRLHCWRFAGRPISDEEAEALYRERKGRGATHALQGAHP